MLIWILKYWKIGAIAALLLALWLAWLNDRHAQYDKGYTDAQTQITAQIAKQESERAAKVQAASHDYQTQKAENEIKERVRYVEVQKIVEKPVYNHVCFDDDGLRELNRAIGGK